MIPVFNRFFKKTYSDYVYLWVLTPVPKVLNILNAFNTVSNVTPVSASTASHIGAVPNKPTINTTSFASNENVILNFTILIVFLAILIIVGKLAISLDIKIPSARGRIRSRKIENVKEEVVELAKKGIKEIVVTGIHVASYGKDLKEDIGLIDLLEEINKIDGIERIRLSSLEPTLITEDFVNRLSKLNKICDHFHLSLQSGCDGTLKRMNRHYTTSEFKKATELLRKAYPNVALTTDIIVGFPGETDEEFNTTYEFLKNIDFYKMHVFKYSPRHGTKAEKMPNQVDGNIKEERSRKLIELSAKNEKEQNKKYINTYLKVLIEELEDGYYKGHTTNYIMVKIKENAENLQNKIVTAKIIGEEGIDLIGKLEEVYW